MKTEFFDLLRIVGVAAMASFVRVIYHRQERLIDNILMFTGGVFFGSIIGYLVAELPALAEYSHILSAGAALAGKELAEVVITQVPAAFKRIITKFSK